MEVIREVEKQVPYEIIKIVEVECIVVVEVPVEINIPVEKIVEV